MAHSMFISGIDVVIIPAYATMRENTGSDFEYVIEDQAMTISVYVTRERLAKLLFAD